MFAFTAYYISIPQIFLTFYVYLGTIFYKRNLQLFSDLFPFLPQKTSALYEPAVIKIRITENLSGTTLRTNTEKVARRLCGQLKRHLLYQRLRGLSTITLRWNIGSREPAHVTCAVVHSFHVVQSEQY